MPTFRERMASLVGRGPEPVTALTLTPDLVRANPRTSLDVDAQIGTALFRFPQRRGVMPEQARAFADRNEWCRAAICRLKDKVARAEHEILPIDPDKPYNQRIQAEIAYLIENPNPMGTSWRGFIEPVCEDLLVLGRAGWEYVPNWRGWPVALYPFNAEYMRINPEWDGTKPRDPRYFWIPVPREVLPLRNDEVTMMLLNPSTWREDGLSPIDTLKDAIEADESGNEYVRTMLKKYPPPGWLHLGASAGPRQVRSVSDKLETDVLGSGGMLVTGGLDSPTFTSLWNGTSRENELMEWSKYFAHKICSVFGLSPQDIGLTFDVNKSTAESQEGISAEGGYKSLLLLIEEYINREVIGKFGTPETLNLHFAFKELTAKDKLKQIQWVKEATGGVPIMLMNEGRREMDLEPLELGNAIYVVGTGGPIALLGEDKEAYNRQRANELAEDAEREAAEEHKPTGSTATTDKSPKGSASTGGGAATKEQDTNAANSDPQNPTPARGKKKG